VLSTLEGRTGPLYRPHSKTGRFDGDPALFMPGFLTKKPKMLNAVHVRHPQGSRITLELRKASG